VLEQSGTGDETAAAASTSHVPPRSGSGAVTLHCLVLIAIVAALWAPRLRGPIDMRWDAGVYYVLGTSLAEGKGYRLLNEPGDIAAVQYPPLLPAMVAVTQAALGTSDITVVGPWLRYWSIATTFAFVLLSYALLARHVSGWWAMVGAAFTALYINTFYLSDNLYAEIPFGVATMVFLLATGTRTPRDGERAPSWREPLAAIAAVAAYLLRTAGVAVLAAWVFDAMLARRWKLAIGRAAIAAIPMLAWQGYLWSVTHGDGYRQVAYEYQRAPYYYSNVTYAENTKLIDPFKPEDGVVSLRARAKTTVRNGWELVVSSGAAMSTFHDIWTNEFRWVGWKALGLGGTRRWELMAYAAVCTLAVIAFAGAVIVWRRGGRMVVLYALFTYGLLLLVPWPQQYVRYLMPLTPILWLFALVAMSAAVAATRGWPRMATVTVAALVVVGVALVQLWALAWSFKGGVNTVEYHAADGRRVTGKLLYFSPPWQGLLESLQWVRERAAPDDVVATTIPHSAYAWTGMKSVLPPLERNRDEARRLLDTVPARYVVTDILQYPRISQRYVAPAVSQDPRWRKVYTSSVGSSSVYERVPPGEVPATAPATAPTTRNANEGAR
jgi:hypothetical protein